MTNLTPRPISLGEQDAATNDATEEIDVDDNDVHTTWENDATEEIDVDDNDVHTTWENDAAVEKELRPLRKE